MKVEIESKTGQVQYGIRGLEQASNDDLSRTIAILEQIKLELLDAMEYDYTAVVYFNDDLPKFDK